MPFIILLLSIALHCHLGNAILSGSFTAASITWDNKLTITGDATKDYGFILKIDPDGVSTHACLCLLLVKHVTRFGSLLSSFYHISQNQSHEV